MKIPQGVQEELDKLNDYENNPYLKEFDILHLYPLELAYPGGYYDSRYFLLIGFNSRKMEKYELGKKDGLTFRGGVLVDVVRIFFDGSTLIRFKHLVRVSNFSDAEVYSDNLPNTAILPKFNSSN